VFVSQEKRFLSGMPRERFKVWDLSTGRRHPKRTARRACRNSEIVAFEREDGLHATIEFFFDQAKVIVL
jgi:hypothetical protein